MKSRDFAYTAFLTLTYCVFATVSTTVFDTFNCGRIGDDPNFYLASDQSVICTTRHHFKFKIYAGFMTIVYPFGIPALYCYVLSKNRDQIGALDRDYDPDIQKISFLWENYERNLWWFEVFECGRRLALSGILVFVAQGTASQIVVALLVSAMTTGLYIHWRPFERDSDDDLAIATQTR